MTQYMQRIAFPEEAIGYFNSIFEALGTDAKASLQKAQEQMLGVGEWKDLTPEEGAEASAKLLGHLAVDTGIPEYSLDMLCLIRCLPEMERRFTAAGVSDEIFTDTAKDLTWKLLECRKLTGVWGTVTYRWFKLHMHLQIFALGRLQYQYGTFWPDTTVSWNGYTLKHGDKTINLHIPSCGPLTEETRMDSYRKAFRFFGATREKPLLIHCTSWLLTPAAPEIFPKDSNLMNFWLDFAPVYTHCGKEAFGNAWRVFNMPFTGDASVLPRNSTLQRNIIRYLESGRILPEGCGLLLFDGERVLSRQTI